MGLDNAAFWGFLGLAAACLLARLAMIWTIGHEEWGRRLLWLAGASALAAAVCFLWPYIRTHEATTAISASGSQPIAQQNARAITNNFGGFASQLPPENRDPNALYQFDAIVGSVQGAVLSPEHSAVTFVAIRLSKPVDPQREIQYQDWVLICNDLPEPPNGFVGMYSAVVAGAKCRIAGKRK
jgi:hypothetical protein